MAILFSVVLAVIATIPAVATTYVVRPDGTGDFPTIQAAIDAATDGDIIELTDGTFTGPGNRDIDYIGRAITIRSQSGNPGACAIDCQELGKGFRFSNGEGSASVLEGVTIANGRGVFTGGIDVDHSSPVIRNCFLINNFTNGLGGGGLRCFYSSPTITDCSFVDNTSMFGAGGVACLDYSYPVIDNCIFDGNSFPPDENIYGTGGMYCQIASPTITNCIFTNNWAGAGEGGLCCVRSSPLVVNCSFWGNRSHPTGGMASDLDSSPILENTIIAFCSEGEAVTCRFGGTVTLICCDIYGNEGGDWIDCIEDQYGVDGNISEDPLFCDPVNNDFTLDCNSPCLPGNHPDGVDCGLIGALGQGCGATAVEETSWGRIKALYRR